MSVAHLVERHISGEEVAAEAERLRRAWAQPRGLVGFLSEVDPKRIGLRFIVTALVSLA